jgi:hypothetical protein
MFVYYVSCSAPNNLLVHYYVDITLVSTTDQHGERVDDGGEVREVKRLESHGPGGLQVAQHL